ncbi:MAG TPA: PA14 domain-containing protein [Polyangia bacterium]|nr:PA14 domain-containing protein [Polyangia bacterium]
MNRSRAHRAVAVGLAVGMAAMVAGSACVDLNRPPSLDPGGAGGAGGAGGGGVGSGGVGGTTGSGGNNDVGGETRPPLGQPCQMAAECATNFCVDGVCCDTACNGPCESCGAVGNEGVCRLLEAGTDPKDACPDDGAMTCGRDGMCDGAGACRLYGKSTVCRPGGCGGSSTFAAHCSGSGACVSAVLTSCYPYTCGSTTACRTMCTTATDCVSPSACFLGTCGGITGVYFDNPDFTGKSFSRIERQIDFDWGVSSPNATIAPDNWSARWTGRLTPPATDLYTFYGYSDDGIRVWIDDALVLEDWRIRAPTETRGNPIPLIGGKAVAIKVEYYDDGGTALARLSWSSSQISKQVVPVTALTP